MSGADEAGINEAGEQMEALVPGGLDITMVEACIGVGGKMDGLRL